MIARWFKQIYERNYHKWKNLIRAIRRAHNNSALTMGYGQSAIQEIDNAGCPECRNFSAGGVQTSSSPAKSGSGAISASGAGEGAFYAAAPPPVRQDRGGFP
jgi:hypothetical protein